MPKGLAYNVSFFGAQPGSLLVSHKLGIRLILRGGAVPPCGKLRAMVSEGDLIDCMSKATGLGVESCKDELKKVPEPDDFPNARALGQDCRHSFTKSVCASMKCPTSALLELVDPGELRTHAKEAGNLEALEALVGVPTPFWKILSLCGKHSLSLRRGIYRTEHTAGALAPSNVPSSLPLTDLHTERSGPTGAEGGALIVELPKLGVALKLDNRTKPLSAAEVRTVAISALSKDEIKHVDKTLEALRRATPAFLKSLLQKLVRHYGTTDPVATDESIAAPRRVLLACSVAALFQHVGSFVPELQTYVRGVVALLKRAAVIAIEDGYPSDKVIEQARLTPKDLFLLAVAFRDNKQLHPSQELAERVVAFCMGCLESPRRINWQAMKAQLAESNSKAVKKKARINVDESSDESSKGWGLASRALIELGAMQGDKEMLRAVAEGGPLQFVEYKPQGEKLPFSVLWALDFHCVRGILHGIEGGSFLDKKMKMFRHFTGVDPRGLRPGYGYDKQLMSDLKPLLLFSWNRMIKSERTAIPVTGQFEERMEFDACPISYMVGDLSQRIKGKDYIVTLGTKDSLAEEVVIARPSRAARDVLDVPKAVKEEAIQAVRSKTYPLGSPFEEGSLLSFSSGRWVLTLGRSKEVVDADEYCDQPLPVKFDEHAEAIPKDQTELLKLASQTGSGFRKGWWSAILESLGALPRKLWDRVLVTLSSVEADGKIQMPVYALQQGSPSSAKDGDELVYAFFLKVAVQCPSALRAEQLPIFQVGDLFHFLFLRRRLKAWIFENTATESKSKTAGATTGAAEASTSEAARATSAATATTSTTTTTTPTTTSPERASTSATTFQADSSGSAVVTDAAATATPTTTTAAAAITATTAATAAPAPPQTEINNCKRSTETISTAASSSSSSSDDAKVDAQVSTAEAFIKPVERTLKTGQALALGRLKESKQRVQFIFAPTGAGKTFTALSYVRTLNVDTVLWIAPDEAVKSLEEEIKKCTSATVNLVSTRGKTGRVDFKPKAVNIIRYDHAKGFEAIAALKSWASRAALVLDEADKLFGETKRSSAMLELAHVSANVVMMSATVLRSSNNLEPLFAWANLLSDFPTSRKNLFVFYASLVNFQREAAIKQTFRTDYVDVLLGEDYRRAVLSRRWLEAADLVYGALDGELVKAALAEEGTMLVGRSKEHAKRLLDMLCKAQKASSKMFGDFDAAAQRAEQGKGALKVCVIPLSKHRGYNFGKFYKRMVMPPLPSSVSTRVQLYGRLTRMDQQFKEVTYITLVPRRTILELLFDRHRFDDAVQASIEKLGQRFGHLAEAMLEAPAEAPKQGGSQGASATTKRAAGGSAAAASKRARKK